MWFHLLALAVLIHLAPAMPSHFDLRQHQMEEEWMDELRGEPESLFSECRPQWYPEYQEGNRKEPDASSETFLKRIRRILADY